MTGRHRSARRRGRGTEPGRRSLSGPFAPLALLVLLGGCAAPTAPTPAGDWAGWGYLDEGGDLPLRLHVTASPDEGFTATLDSPAEPAFGLPLQTVEWSAPRLRLERTTDSGRLLVFEAELREDVLDGTMDFAGTPGRFQLHRSPELLPTVDPASYAGCVGTYRFADGSAVIIGSRFWGELLYTDLETGRHGTLFPRSPSEFFAGSAMYVPGPITAEATFRRDDAGEVTGLTWTERGKPARSGLRAPLVEEEVRFAGAGVPLAGTLIRPEGPGPFPAVVVLGGSNWDIRGSIRRDAEIFAAFGVAALIYDKRGYGESGGEPTVPFRTTAEDAAAALHHLRKRPDILPDQIGLTGTSRGGWFAPLAASISDGASFLVLFVPPAVSPAEQETTRRLNRMRDDGADEMTVELAEDLLRHTWAYARTGEGWQDYLELRRRAVEAAVPDYVFETDSPDPEAWEWVRLNMQYDPIPVLETLRIPVLALFGGADRNVDPEVNLPRMRAALERAGNEDFELVVLPGADHGLRVSSGDAPVPLHRTVGFAPGRWSTVRTWLVAHLPGL